MLSNVYLKIFALKFHCCCLTTPLTLVCGGGGVRSSRFWTTTGLSLYLVSSSTIPAGSVHKSRGDNVVRMWMQLKRCCVWLQTTQPTSGGAVTVVSSCCANCVEPPRPQQWGPDLPFFGHAGHADPLDGWRCCSQKRVMSRPIQVRQL